MEETSISGKKQTVLADEIEHAVFSLILNYLLCQFSSHIPHRAIDTYSVKMEAIHMSEKLCEIRGESQEGERTAYRSR